MGGSSITKRPIINIKTMGSLRISTMGGLLCLLAAFAYLYKDVLINLVRTWSSDGNYSHGFLVPIVVAFIIWSKRRELQAIPLKPFWPALAFVLLSGLILIAGQLSIHRFAKHCSLFLMIFSLVLLISGKAWTRRLMLPLSFLIFMFPLPELFRRVVSFRLQLLSSYISVNLLSMMNYPLYREGNIIQLPHMSLSVAEACSGLRSLVALTFLAAIAGYFFLKSNRRRLLLILCAFPVAIVLNWARITGTVLLSSHFGEEVALSFFHSFSGLLVFGGGTILIASIMFMLGRREKQKSLSEPVDDTITPVQASVKMPVVIVSVMMLLLISLYSNFLFSLKPEQYADLKSLSLNIGPYVGEEEGIDPSVTEKSNVTSDRRITFHRSGEPGIDVYLGYYRTGRHLAGFFHGADVCLPGAGWKIVKKEKIPLNHIEDRGESPAVLKYISTKGQSTQILITWLQAGSLVDTDSRMMRLRLVLDTVLNSRYPDTTKVMLQTLVGDRESQEMATERLIRFMTLFYPEFIKLNV